MFRLKGQNICKTILKSLFDWREISAILGILLFSCQDADTDKIFTYKVSRHTFSNTVICSGVIEAKKSVMVACPEIWPEPKINTLLPEGTQVKKDDIVCRLESSQVQNEFDRSLNELETSKADYKKTEANLRLQRALLEAQVKNVEASADIARLQAAQLAYVSPTRKRLIELQIQRSEIEKAKIEKKLVSLELVQQSELNRMRLMIKQAENRVNRAQMFLDRLILKAPADGIIVYAVNWITDQKVKEGDVLWRGIPIVEIPETSVLQSKIAVDETDIKRIKKDQIVQIHIDALPSSAYSGKVTRISAMGKPIKRNSKIKTFEVVAELDSSHLALQPGLTTTNTIFIETIPDTFAIPAECLFRKDSLDFVYAREKGKFRTLPVKLGPRSDNFILVSDGLSGGEELALLEPPHHLTMAFDVAEKTKK